MKKLITITTACLSLFVASLYAQDATKKRKPNFSLDAKTMSDLGVTEEQKQKMAELKKTMFDGEIKKLQVERNEVVKNTEMQQDSLLSADQKQKVVALKETIKAQNKENPSLRKVFVFDKKTMDEIGIAADVQKKLTVLVSKDQVKNWTIGQEQNKVFKAFFEAQENVLTAEQKKKVEAMRTEIAEYNKGI